MDSRKHLFRLYIGYIQNKNTASVSKCHKSRTDIFTLLLFILIKIEYLFRDNMTQEAGIHHRYLDLYMVFPQYLLSIFAMSVKVNKLVPHV